MRREHGGRATTHGFRGWGGQASPAQQSVTTRAAPPSVPTRIQAGADVAWERRGTHLNCSIKFLGTKLHHVYLVFVMRLVGKPRLCPAPSFANTSRGAEAAPRPQHSMVAAQQVGLPLRRGSGTRCSSGQAGLTTGGVRFTCAAPPRGTLCGAKASCWGTRPPQSRAAARSLVGHSDGCRAAIPGRSRAQ